jgi:hypothetical protein
MERHPAARIATHLFLVIFAASSHSVSAMAAGADLPVYPGARVESLARRVHSGTSICGHTITVEKSMTVDADPRAIVRWYEGRYPGSRTIDIGRATNDTTSAGDPAMTELEIIAADGSQTIVVNRMNFASGKLREASKAMGLDRAQIGIERIAPAFGSSYIALVAQVAAGGASAKLARAQLEAACKD